VHYDLTFRYKGFDMSLPPLSHEHLLNYDDICKIIEKQNFWVEYEPIIDMNSGDIFGYEALARFVINGKQIPPTPVLHVAHQVKELFFRLESALKIMQLAHRPKDARMLFVNIDPHNFSDSDKILYWRDLFEEERDICIEVTENTDDMQTSLLSHCLDEIQKSGIPIAQDDIGNDQKPFCFDLTKRAQFLKFDRTWLLKIRACADYQEILKGFLSFAKAQGKKSILEGVESEEDFAVAKALGVDFVQGYIFKHLNISSQKLS
jgi:EAL domain-containing protein (putative c-di-GMP-specific phosphodiesterase class I)